MMKSLEEEPLRSSRPPQAFIIWKSFAGVISMHDLKDSLFVYTRISGNAFYSAEHMHVRQIG
jgi:hypothetical protein